MNFKIKTRIFSLARRGEENHCNSARINIKITHSMRRRRRATSTRSRSVDPLLFSRRLRFRIPTTRLQRVPSFPPLPYSRNWTCLPPLLKFFKREKGGSGIEVLGRLFSSCTLR